MEEKKSIDKTCSIHEQRIYEITCFFICTRRRRYSVSVTPVSQLRYQKLRLVLYKSKLFTLNNKCFKIMTNLESLASWQLFCYKSVMENLIIFSGSFPWEHNRCFVVCVRQCFMVVFVLVLLLPDLKFDLPEIEENKCSETFVLWGFWWWWGIMLTLWTFGLDKLLPLLLAESKSWLECDSRRWLCMRRRCLVLETGESW